MYKTPSENTNVNPDQNKLYTYFETDAEGIRQFNAASPEEKSGATLCRMRIRGETVPAIRVEVTSEAYNVFKKSQWHEEDQYRQENRCTVSGANGKSIVCPRRVKNPDYTGAPGETKTIANDCENCPYGCQHLFRPTKGILYFSTLDTEDDQGNTEAFDPAGNQHFSEADTYLQLLSDLINFVKTHYPKYAAYTDLIDLLGHDLDIKTASQIMGKPKTTLYGWLKKLRPIFDEFIDTVDIL